MHEQQTTNKKKLRNQSYAWGKFKGIRQTKITNELWINNHEFVDIYVWNANFFFGKKHFLIKKTETLRKEIISEKIKISSEKTEKFSENKNEWKIWSSQNESGEFVFSLINSFEDPSKLSSHNYIRKSY